MLKSLFLLIFAATPAFAADNLLTHMEKTNSKGAVVAFYGAECGENWVECVHVDLKCDAPGEFRATALDFDHDAIASWLHNQKGAAALAVDGRSFPLSANDIGWSDLNGSWDVSLYVIEGSAEIWRSLKTARTIRLIVGQHTVVLPSTKHVAAAAAICESDPTKTNR